MRIVGENSNMMMVGGRLPILRENRYLIKVRYWESPLEQTFKVNQFDIASEAELQKIVDESFSRGSHKPFPGYGSKPSIGLERL